MPTGPTPAEEEARNASLDAAQLADEQAAALKESQDAASLTTNPTPDQEGAAASDEMNTLVVDEDAAGTVTPDPTT